MNIYEAMFVRKSVRNFQFAPISPQEMEDIMLQFKDIKGLHEETESELVIFDNRKNQYKMLNMIGVKAPYYLALYSDVCDRAYMNAGYLMQQMALYLCTMNLGSCFVGTPVVTKELQVRGKKRLMAVLAFGKPVKSCTRRPEEANRLSLDQLCVFKENPKYWVKQILDAARMAPSSMNSQPWRFVVLDNRIHIYTKKQRIEYLSKWNELDFGILLANMMVVADEKWLDVELVRLEGLANKQFPNTEYVLSAVVRA